MVRWTPCTPCATGCDSRAPPRPSDGWGPSRWPGSRSSSAGPRRAPGVSRPPTSTGTATDMTFAACLLASLFGQLPAGKPTAPPTRPLGTLREQAAIQQQWLRYRLDSVLPGLMRKHGVSMWVIPMRESDADPVFWALVSPTTFFARRRTIYVFTDRGADRGVERLALGGASQGGVYEAYQARETIDPSIGRRPELVGQAQWDLLRRVIEERDPHTIAVDISHTHAFADGLSAGEWEQLQTALPEQQRPRVVRAEELALEYQEIRAPGMLPVYRRMMEIVWGIID